MSNRTVLGLDIGGTHITAALVDLEKKIVVESSRRRQLIDARADADRILSSWADIIRAGLKQADGQVVNIGIAMPGPFDYAEGISLINEQDKFKSLYKLNLKKELSQRVGIAAENIRFMNDAACFLQGEVFGGAAQGYEQVLGLTLGTGLGSAFCDHGVAVDASLWSAPFSDGIAEDYLSTRWFVKRFEELSGRQMTGVKEIVDQGLSDPLVLQLFNEFGDTLGRFLLTVFEEYRAGAVVIGGNISRTFELFLPAVLGVTSNAFSHVELKQAILNEDAALIGAGSCWKEIIV